MLVIYRKPGESLYIGESIEIIVDRLDDGQVKLLVSAPREIEVHRDDYRRPDRRGHRGSNGNEYRNSRPGAYGPRKNRY